MSFFDIWRHLNSHFDACNSSAHEQLVGYKLLALFNAQMFPTELKISDRELQRLTGIKSTQSIVDARRRLKNAGLLDFKTGTTGTRYRLNTSQTLSEHSASTNQAQANRSSRITPSVFLNPKKDQDSPKTASAREEAEEWRAFKRFGIEGGDCPKGVESNEH